MSRGAREGARARRCEEEKAERGADGDVGVPRRAGRELRGLFLGGGGDFEFEEGFGVVVGDDEGGAAEGGAFFGGVLREDLGPWGGIGEVGFPEEAVGDIGGGGVFAVAEAEAVRSGVEERGDGVTGGGGAGGEAEEVFLEVYEAVAIGVGEVGGVSGANFGGLSLGWVFPRRVSRFFPIRGEARCGDVFGASSGFGVKILFDENVPYPLKKFLAGHVVSTVQECGWRGVGNGELLNLAEESFDVFILADKNMRYQQKTAGRRIAIVELPTNRWPLLVPLAGRIAEAVDGAREGDYKVLDF